MLEGPPGVVGRQPDDMGGLPIDVGEPLINKKGPPIDVGCGQVVR